MSRNIQEGPRIPRRLLLTGTGATILAAAGTALFFADRCQLSAEDRAIQQELSARKEPFDKDEAQLWKSANKAWQSAGLLGNPTATVAARRDIADQLLRESKNEFTQTIQEARTRNNTRIVIITNMNPTPVANIESLAANRVERNVAIFSPLILPMQNPEELIFGIGRSIIIIDEEKKLEQEEALKPGSRFLELPPQQQQQIIRNMPRNTMIDHFTRATSAEFEARLAHLKMTGDQAPHTISNQDKKDLAAYALCKRNPDPNCWRGYANQAIVARPRAPVQTR